MCIEVGMTCHKVCKQGGDASDIISDTYEQTTWVHDVLYKRNSRPVGSPLLTAEGHRPS